MHIHPPHSHFKGSSLGGEITGRFQIPRSDKVLYEWDVKYDSNGFRNDSDLTSADIAVIGDSFVENMTTPTPELFTSRLSRLQHKVVANLGQYGYGPLEELAVLRRYALPLHPHTIVWMFYEANDLKDVIHFQKDGRRLAKTADPPAPQSQRSFIRNARNQIRTQLNFALRPAGRKRAGVMTMANGQERNVYFAYPAESLSADDYKALDDTAATLSTAEKLSASQGVRFIFVFIPTKFRAFHQYTRFSAASECRNWVLNDMPERLQKAVGPLSSSVAFVDLTPYLADAVKRGELPYHTDDDHWAPTGEEIGAEVINRYLSTVQAEK